MKPNVRFTARWTRLKNATTCEKCKRLNQARERILYFLVPPDTAHEDAKVFCGECAWDEFDLEGVSEGPLRRWYSQQP